MSPIVEIENISKCFGATRVLEGVSFAVDKGSVVAIIGQSGSGKSTALRCIDRLETVDQGGGYPVRIRGLSGGVRIDRTVQCTSVREAWQASRHWPQLREAVGRGTVRVVVSNTADSGYLLDDRDGPQALQAEAPPHSFPAKLLVLLHGRWQTAPEVPLTLLPCELIERNGAVLREVVAGLAARWSLEPSFVGWLRTHCVWANSLVDRIVSETIVPVGAVAEPYAVWVVERQPGLVLPCRHPAIVPTDSLAAHGRLKLFLLNAGHTFLAERWLRDGRAADETVGMAMADPTRASIVRGKQLVQQMLVAADAVQRQPVPSRHLVVGQQCGGSDGYSGISANPVLGAAVDLLVRHGGSAILSETPEIYGAEHLLTRRATSLEVADKLMQRLAWRERHAALHGGDLNNNPSPGNKARGITTILEKSLGAQAKAGTSGLMEVLEYAESVRAQGLVFMDTPGYDPVSATGQVAGGANLICFTTDRGSTYGCKPVPSLKLASNSAMFRRMALDMDFDCGGVVDGRQSIAEAGAQLFRLMLETASGRVSASEVNGLGDNEFLPWQLGAVM